MRTPSKTIYDNYRNLLDHNSALAITAELAIGHSNGLVFETRRGKTRLNLVPFLEATMVALEKFLPKAADIIGKSKQLQDILRKKPHGQGTPQEELDIRVSGAPSITGVSDTPYPDI